eukprot:TRINITY_DN668_c0_g1_i5.p1 TRINITY_DN668_c0_g1~~TRINITY_DN668_c0_g1_i5.p1  ORF type:complete len:697 (+),score=136.01 TRINITY_DN668_c0_g1_i5:208-2298(+)
MSRPILIALFTLFVSSLLPSYPCALVQYSFTALQVPGNPDGYPLPVLGYFDNTKGPLYYMSDRPFPGPLIRAKMGDTLQVDITNGLGETKITTHFHGIHQKNNVWMDGTYMITECGISGGQTFRYLFNVTQTGTYWYHSHAGPEYTEGLLGPMIIDYPDGEEDPVMVQFQYVLEHVLILQDWDHETSDQLGMLYAAPRGIFPGFQPQFPWTHRAILINGRGQFNCKYNNCMDGYTPSEKGRCAGIPQCLVERPPLIGPCNATAYPIDEYTCQPGKYIRIRIINSASNMPLQMWIDRHNMTIVARDGLEVAQRTVPFITIPVGQRLDVMVLCDQDPGYKYSMIYTVPAVFIPLSTNLDQLWSHTYLTYAANTSVVVPHIIPLYNYSAARDLGSLMYANDTNLEYTLPPAPAPNDAFVAEPADARVVINYGVVWDSRAGWPLEEWVLNFKRFMSPNKPYLQSVLLGQLDSIQQNVEQVRATGSGISTFNYTRETSTIELEYGKVYEFVIVSEDFYQQHPWHMHGHTLNFTAYGSLPLGANSSTDECQQTWQANGKVSELVPDYTLPQPIIARGDSFTVAEHGFVAFRFRADNPGPWLFHCHVDWHMSQGMTIIFNVGQKGNSYANLPPPPAWVPQCGVDSLWGPPPAPPPIQKGDTLLHDLKIAGATFFATLVVVGGALSCIVMRRRLRSSSGYSSIQ